MTLAAKIRDNEAISKEAVRGHRGGTNPLSTRLATSRAEGEVGARWCEEHLTDDSSRGCHHSKATRVRVLYTQKNTDHLTEGMA